MAKSNNILISPCSSYSIQFRSIGEFAWFYLQQVNLNHICLIDAQTEEQLTVSELKSRSNSIAVALINRGITKTDKIAFSGQNSIQHSILRFVTIFTGNTILPLSPKIGELEVEERVRNAGIDVIFSSAQDLYKFKGILKNIKLLVVFDTKDDKYVTFEQLLKEGKNQTLNRIPYFDVNPEKDMALLIYTSGTTGESKCAMISHKAYINISHGMFNYYKPFKSCLPITVGMSHPLGQLNATRIMPFYVMTGSTVVLFQDFCEKSILQSIEKYRINCFQLIHQFVQKLLESEWINKYNLDSMKVSFIGGQKFLEKIARCMIRKYNLKFSENYSMTEYIAVTIGSDTDEEYIPGNCGQISPGTQLKIVDLTTGECLGPDIDGEILIRGNRMFSGYLNNDSATTDAFDRDGWYRTGDIGHYDHKERIFITDRLKELINVSFDACHVSAVTIEQFLLTHKSIADTVVVGVNNSSGFQCPRAYVVLKEEQNISSEDIQKWVSETHSPTKRLTGGVVFVDHIQKTSNGKIDRKYYRNVVKDELID